MAAPISVRLDDKAREELEAHARARNIGLSTLLRDIATEPPGKRSASAFASRAKLWANTWLATRRLARIIHEGGQLMA